MIDVTIEYPEGMETTAEQREYDSFLLSYISTEAVRQRSRKIRVELDEVEAAWQEHKRNKQQAH